VKQEYKALIPVKTVPRLVDGEWRMPQDGRAIDVIDPADTRRIVARAPAMTAAEVTELYDAAGRAAPDWGAASPLASVRSEPLGVVCLITPWNDPLLTPARKAAPALIAGNAVVLKPATETPLVALHLARAQGATVATGGYAPLDGVYEHGCYVTPTVLSDVLPEMAIWREEVFGPVVAVRAVDGFDAAIEAVNDSAYGLAAGVFTTSLHRAHEFARRAEAGQVAVNLPTPGWDVHMPFGGFGDSGSAFKEQGAEALRFYTRIKTVAMQFGGAR
jgi:acyl-CoA reductase-like NAD-dependent aldehyde dehydrogenase